MTHGKWIIIKDLTAWEAALKLTKGIYQENFLLGIENLSGSTLTGEARKWSSKYATSRTNLLSRVTAAGIKISETTGKNNRRLLVIG